ncbi:hypothetical protein ACH5RR_039581 [Cinchona calisaya]|uniref:non-specific serine/threonine protein kinase n=1 Tax=Cinchona calisaya TaxID=153742 RepID=A0ABD2XZ45_9GENT
MILCNSNLFLLLVLLVPINLSLLASADNIFQNETDWFALLEFKREISDDPYGVLNSWNDSQHHCSWQGVTCGPRHGRVTALTLSGKSLLGSISPHIGNLSFMKFIALNENRFQGEIPQEIGRLFRLRSLNLSRNILTGEIPVNLSHCLEINELSLFRNQLVGKIPTELGFLKKLEILYLYTNNLTGEIPRSFGNLSSMTILSLTYNNLEGNLPEQLGFLANLFDLSVGVNKLSGVIPPAVYNNSAITIFSITSNFFHGIIPADIGLRLPNLQKLEFYGNQFSGDIPVSVSNLSKLTMLEVGENSLKGQVPDNLGKLSKLQLLNIEVNLLGSNSAKDLSFIASLTNCSNLQALAFGTNNFGGELPNIIVNLSSQMTQIYVNQNNISGSIPIGFGRFVNLFTLNMEQNSFTGVVPGDLNELQNLQYLSLSENSLTGKIPSDLCKIKSLYALDLSRNSFDGDITLSLQNCQYLKQLDISRNNLSGIITPLAFGMSSSSSLANVDLSHNLMSGSIPFEVGKLTNLNIFIVSYNNFSGEIPTTLGDCLGLEYLSMEVNLFQGKIPTTFVSLKGLQHLDLSSNNLTGQVPRGLQTLTFLKYLNLSFNDLEGEIPTDGVFGNASGVSVVGNRKLCGGIPELQLTKCIIQRKKKKNHLVIILTSTACAVILIFAALMVCIFIYHKRAREKDSPAVRSEVDKVLRISYQELYRATEGFSSTNLIGSGSFGFVYKGSLDQHGDRLVAIKVLDIQKNGASKTFKAECRALRNIRHRNLVSLLTYCSSIDPKGNEFMALVYEYMENGSLDKWLLPEKAETTSSKDLNFLERLNITIDVASALDYLHNQSEVAVVHCDLKPSNILLDKNMVAHVGDFGLARLLPKASNNSTQLGSTSSAAGIKGTIGYAAPEYGMGLEASTEGDVYSFGILLLEMFTGRRPTDDTFMDGLNLHNYVKMALPEHIWEIVDPSINSKQENREALASIFRVGLGCSERSPKDRMHMKEVTRRLYHIRDAFLSLCKE